MRALAAALVLALLACTGGGAMAEPAPPVSVQAGLAIRGYDPVAFFTAGRPVQGSSRFALKREGIVWHFSSAENRDRFLADPAAFAPQFGGYCAWAVSQGYLARGDPEH
jgi:YHS domain-containing protein